MKREIMTPKTYEKMRKNPIGKMIIKRGLSIGEFSRHMGLPESTVRDIATGKSSPYLHTLKTMATALGISTWQLVRQIEETETV